MYKPLLTLWAFVFATQAIAQSDTAVSAVHYNFSHLRDTNNPSKIYTERTVLLLGKKESVYQSYDRMVSGAIVGKIRDDVQKLPIEQRRIPVTIPKGLKWGSPEFYYKNIPEEKFRFMENFFGNYFYLDEPLPVIKWNIEPETKMIGTYQCQRATTSFKGRNYEAWFCVQLPYQDGPWKLNGLPGLILEAYDTRKQVVFAFDHFDTAVENPVPIELHKRALLATRKELERVRETVKKNIQAMMAGNAGAGSMTKKPGSQSSSDDDEDDPVINNPIELQDK